MRLFSFLIISSLVFSHNLVAEIKQHSLEDLLEYKCSRNNSRACDELSELQTQKQQVKFMDERVDLFTKNINPESLMLDNKRPNLQAVYPLVIKDYFQGLNEAGKLESLIAENKLSECAGHYHDYWINRKLWWPSDDGKPDWGSIYVFIVDHYYGFCLKNF